MSVFFKTVWQLPRKTMVCCWTACTLIAAPPASLGPEPGIARLGGKIPQEALLVAKQRVTEKRPLPNHPSSQNLVQAHREFNGHVLNSSCSRKVYIPPSCAASASYLFTFEYPISKRATLQFAIRSMRDPVAVANRNGAIGLLQPFPRKFIDSWQQIQGARTEGPSLHPSITSCATSAKGDIWMRLGILLPKQA